MEIKITAENAKEVIGTLEYGEYYFVKVSELHDYHPMRWESNKFISTFGKIWFTNKETTKPIYSIDTTPIKRIPDISDEEINKMAEEYATFIYQDEHNDPIYAPEVNQTREDYRQGFKAALNKMKGE